MAEVSLIPEEQKKRSLSHSSSKRSAGPRLSRTAKVGAVLLVIFVVLGGVLFVWRQSLELERDDLRTKLTEVTGRRDAALEKRVRSLNTLLSSFDDVLDNHRRWSRLLTALEDTVVPGIVLTQFEGNYQTAVAALRGLSPNYVRFAEQVRALESIEGVERMDVSSVGLNKEGGVEFSGQIIFDRDLIKSTE